MRVDPSLISEIAHRAACDPRTVRSYLAGAGHQTQPHLARAIDRALDDVLTEHRRREARRVEVLALATPPELR